MIAPGSDIPNGPIEFGVTQKPVGAYSKAVQVLFRNKPNPWIRKQHRPNALDLWKDGGKDLNYADEDKS